MIRAKFLERKNRFTALVDIEGEIVSAHVPNSGRLRELFTPGREVYLVKKEEPGRKTMYDLVLVRYGDCFVSVDARIPNRVISEAIERKELKEFRGFKVVKREVKYGASRLDILAVNKDGRKCFVEVKSVTLVKGKTAMFPDAPTERGARHLDELVRVVAEGQRGVVVFLVQREDAAVFSPNDATDPVFGNTLRKAVAAGVEVYAYTCRVTPEEISIRKAIPVHL